MNQAFLNTLKNRSQSIQSNRIVKQKDTEPIPGKVYAITGNNGNNIASGKDIADCEVIDADPISGPKQIVSNVLPYVEVDFVTDRNRLDLFFQNKPCEAHRALLKSERFRFRPSDNAWYNQDNAGSRLLIDKLASLGFQILYRGRDHSESTQSDCFETYKKQCAELCEHLDLDPADLAIEAIKHFHSHTFNN